MKKEVLYLKIANILEKQITSDTMKIGTRLPSIRTLGRVYDVSINTAKQAYYELERKSLIEARPKSGYFVSSSLKRKLNIPSATAPMPAPSELEPDSLIVEVLGHLEKKEITPFSLGVPDASLLPVEKLNKSIVKLTRSVEGSGIDYEPVQGNANLRRIVAHWSFVWGGALEDEDIITTSGATNAIYHALMATTKPGHSIAVDSPVYINLLQVALAQGLKVIELPTHPVTGVDIEALKKVVPKIKACVLISNFSNPLGSCMPEEHKREVVRLLGHHGIPLIEDDIYGDLFFEDTRPVPCKAYDEEGMVLWLSSVSKTVAPGFRVGWVAPGKFKDKILRQKLVETIAYPKLYQEVIADFMENGRYEHHLRSLRSSLYSNCLNYLRAIDEYFPEGTKVSRPKGGFTLWVELDERINTLRLFEMALKYNISIAPGRMFTLQDQYYNCMRLSFGLKWNERLDRDLATLGKLAAML